MVQIRLISLGLAAIVGGGMMYYLLNYDVGAIKALFEDKDAIKDF